MHSFFFDSFTHIRIIDIIDVILVAILLYEVYNLVKGTSAIKIFIGIISAYLLWKIVKILKMTLLTEILGTFFSVGVIALIVVFQPEIRQFLLLLGNTRLIRTTRGKFLFWKLNVSHPINVNLDKIIVACKKMGDTNTGALIVLTRQNELKTIVDTGEYIEAAISEQLIENIFFKHSPLHDGAMVIVGHAIRAVRCILPVSNNPKIPAHFGLRHRAAIGITEKSDAIAIVVSETTGKITCCISGEWTEDASAAELTNRLVAELNR
ncbi:MAG: TIGR00159 family protein [Bacteroidetes bacterium]|nr:TIGR00159 family protein [Bacteroidota bacterium]